MRKKIQLTTKYQRARVRASKKGLDPARPGPALGQCTPCIANIIPAMDKMHADLTASSENEDYTPTIRAALKLGINLLDKYYSLTDNSEVYQIAISK